MHEVEMALNDPGVARAGYPFLGWSPLQSAAAPSMNDLPSSAAGADVPAPEPTPVDPSVDPPGEPPTPRKPAGFVNEVVSEKDIRKYELREISADFGGGVEYYWTIDRRRNIYLREIGVPDLLSRLRHFSFCWKGELFWFDLEVSGGGVSGAEGYTVWSLGKGSKRKPLRLPEEFEKHREAITSALKDALTAFKPAGLCSSTTVNVVQFDF